MTDLEDSAFTQLSPVRHRTLRVSVLAVGLLLLIALAGLGRASACVGDCDGNGMVSVSELIRGVRISLGDAPLADCPSFDLGGDGQVQINELVTAVSAALAGCPATPTSTATPSDTATPGPSETPTATPTLPMVSGHWREDPLAVTDSTCPELITNEFAADLASRPPCEQIIEMISETAVSFEDCTGTRVEGTLERDGTIRVTYPTTDTTNEGCTVALTASFAVPAGASPTSAAYTFAVSFSGTCPLDDCTIHADGTWTRL